MLKLSDTSLVLINPSPSNVNYCIDRYGWLSTQVIEVPFNEKFFQACRFPIPKVDPICLVIWDLCSSNTLIAPLLIVSLHCWGEHVIFHTQLEFNLD